MLQIGTTLVSIDLVENQFVCDLEKCKGECCVAGDSGAPLEESEMKEIENAFPVIKSYLQQEALQSIEQQGLYLKDADGDLVTPIIDGHRECVYTLFENGIAKCAFEQAYFEGKISFRKPVSCHLYPIRIQKLKDYDAVNYDRWSICSAACTLGKNLKVPVYKFLKEALIRKYGEEWYNELEVVAEAYRNEKFKV
ncbi:MAG: DUF3109 family protein [Bacteroidetes bacterium]|nr:DUF3109 family protein [Bacteroidota bacterium]